MFKVMLPVVEKSYPQMAADEKANCINHRLEIQSIPLQYVNVDMANVLSIAAQVNAYDAYLLDCALRHTAPLLTLDQRLRRAADELNINLVNLEG